MNILKNEIKTPLSPDTINKVFINIFKKNVKIVDVQLVEENKYNLNDLFTEDITKYKCSINNKKGQYLNNIIILFIPVNSAYNGHYQMICKQNNNVFFFDSYGHNYAQLIKKINNSKYTPVKISNVFGNLVLNSDYPLYSNAFKYQTEQLDDDTCGYHCSIVSYYFLTNDNFTFQGYKNFVEKLVEKYKFKTAEKYDYAILTLFNKLHHN